MAATMKKSHHASATYVPLEPTLHPKVLATWEENYSIQVRSKYGDAAVAIIEGTIPLYVRKTFTEVMADDGITDPDALKGFAKHEMQERSKQHSADRKLFNDNVKKIYDDILLHLSSASLLLVSCGILSGPGRSRRRKAVDSGPHLSYRQQPHGVGLRTQNVQKTS